MADLPHLLDDEREMAARAEAATPPGDAREWTRLDYRYNSMRLYTLASLGAINALMTEEGEPLRVANRAFVAAARQDVPTLLSRLSAARAEAERARQLAKHIAECVCPQYDAILCAARRLLARAWEPTVHVRSLSTAEAEAEAELRRVVEAQPDTRIENYYQRMAAAAEARAAEWRRALTTWEAALCDALGGPDGGRAGCGMDASDPAMPQNHLDAVRALRAERDEARAEIARLRAYVACVAEIAGEDET